MQPRILILRAPGTNCDEETAFAFEQAGGRAERLHVRRLLESPDVLRPCQILCIPGGFSYGDDIAAGRILATQVRLRLGDAFSQFLDRGGVLLGICNGMQVLMRTGILLPEDAEGPVATLTWNDSGRFEDRWVNLDVASEKCVLLAGAETLYLPVAHAEGKFVTRDERTLAAVEASGQLVLRYAGPNAADGLVSYPRNPNGSLANVAGLCDATGRALGLMPHPERFIDATQHPHWTRSDAGDVGDGFKLFENAIRYFR